MATTVSYRDIPHLKPLFADAAEKGIKSGNDLADILSSAPSKAAAWPEFLRDEWKKGMEEVFHDVTDKQELSAEQKKLLRAMLCVGLDTPLLRHLYQHLFLALYPKCQNAQGILEILGLLDEKSDLAAAGRRLEVFCAIRPGARFWDAAYGLGKVLSLDEEACEVLAEQERERRIPLALFLEKAVIPVVGGTLDKLFAKETASLGFTKLQDLRDAALESVITRLEPTPTLFERLIAGHYTDDELRTICSNSKERQNTAKAASGTSARWDYSRSLMELEVRLDDAIQKKETTRCDDLNRENLENLLTREASRPQMAARWANVAGLLFRMENTRPLILEISRKLSDKVLLWKDMKLFVEITDKLPGKQVAAWMDLTRQVAGRDFLIEATLQMPFRLWAHTEKLFSAAEDKKALVGRILQDFKENKPTADHYAWLWKSGSGEDRKKYLSDSYLLFKTLHKDLKGNYLKSQRNLHKLLLDDSAFQCAVMRDGDDDAIRNLVRCVKRVPLLDSSEKQSLLVKIVRLFPKARPVVEESGAAQVVEEKQAMERITSNHSYNQLQEELNTLLTVTIPANSKAIEEARANGDLSENSEYKYAKEQQRSLNHRRNFLERELATCRPMDFADQDVNAYVILGARVALEQEKSGALEVTLLGLHDTDSKKNWFSYESPLGQVLLGHKLGDEVTLPAGEKAVIKAIHALDDETLAFLRA